MVRYPHILLLLAVVALPSGAQAPSEEPPQFVFTMNECSMSAGFLTRPELGLKTIPGEKTTNLCSRASEKTIVCEVVMEDGSPGVKGRYATYTVILDSPPILHFSDEERADWITVHTANHAVVSITRVVTADFVGAKVCHGIFATRSELEAMPDVQE